MDKLFKKKQGRFTLDKWMITFVVFAAVFLTGMFIVSDVNSNYGYDGVSIDIDDVPEINESFEELENASSGMREAVFGSEVDEDNTVDSLFKGAFSALRFVRATFNMFGNIINAIAVKIGIPDWMVAFAITAVVIMVVFALIAIIIRFRG